MAEFAGAIQNQLAAFAAGHHAAPHPGGVQGGGAAIIEARAVADAAHLPPAAAAALDAHAEARALDHQSADQDYILYLERFYEKYIDHKNDGKVTAVTNMLDQARDNMKSGQEYLHLHPIPHFDSYTIFFDNAIRAMNLFKLLNQNGYNTIDYLKESSYEMNLIKDTLNANPGPTEKYLSEYVSAALEEVNIARYLQELQQHH